MITKEAIEAGYAAAQVRDIRDERSHKERFVDGLTAAFAAMPGPAVKLDRLRAILRELWAACDMDLKMCDGTIKTGQFGILQDIREDLGLLLSTVALTPAPDLASENERLRTALEEARDAIVRADADVLTDTLWMPEDVSKGETVVDHIAAALERT